MAKAGPAAVTPMTAAVAAERNALRDDSACNGVVDEGPCVDFMGVKPHATAKKDRTVMMVSFMIYNRLYGKETLCEVKGEEYPESRPARTERNEEMGKT